MPFYIDDWAGSLAVQEMTVHERYLYFEMLVIQWREGVVPDDLVKVCRSIRCTVREMRHAWPRVREQFEETTRGQLMNKRMTEHRQEVVKRSVSASESAKVRWNRNARASDCDYDSSYSPETTTTENTSLRAIAAAVDADIDPRTGFVRTLESQIPDVVEALYGSHPKSKDFPLVAGAVVRALTRIGCDELLFTHSLWVRTDAWRKENARYCPTLPKWLDDRGYDSVPDEFDSEYQTWRTTHEQKTEQRPAWRNGDC